MTLAELVPGGDPRPIAGITADSRAVQPGFAFFALPGAKADGLAFVEQALANGATAIVAQREPDVATPHAATLVVPDARHALAHAAAAFYPRQPETIVAVTGTSGKSSVVDFARQLFAAQGHAAASLGTIGVVKPDGATYGSLTTPDPVSLHRTLDELAGEGVTHLAMEASSHGLDQKRLDGVRLTAAAFTNLGRDHLDYHPSLEAYGAAKLRLFETLLSETGVAVIDMDDERSPVFAEAAARRGIRVIGTGGFGEELMLVEARPHALGQEIDVAWSEIVTVDVPLIGAFQVSNALVAAGLVIAAGAEPESVIRSLADLKGVPGRMEQVGTVRSAPVVVDYAHKPDALEAVLDALAPFADGRIICVFGCGGDRDAGKRPIMGRIAAERADIVIVTDDNPRSENPAAIRAAIRQGAPDALEIGSREEAIRAAIHLAQTGDVVLIAGKGHETGQIVGDTVLPFSDQQVARAAILEETR